MAQTGIPRTTRPGSLNSAAGPVPVGATVPMSGNSGSQWNPTVANLLVLVVIEMVAFAAIRYLFRKVV